MQRYTPGGSEISRKVGSCEVDSCDLYSRARFQKVKQSEIKSRVNN